MTHHKGPKETAEPTSLTVRIIGTDLPGRAFEEFRDVHVAVQRGREPYHPVPGDAAGARWDLPVQVVTGRDGEPDFRGPFVQGRPGERFFYLTWGELPKGGEFAMFRRAKVFFADLPAGLLAGGTAVGRFGLTDDRGGPLCAAVRPPRITWEAGADG
ncbi:DUF5990 family protein [Streptomyces sp. NPDC058657]|uniref:DUF5990 family protein n=1 Tax=unclassified Streptomyces TaxID=2593676 RepID=UPI003669F8AF